MLSLLGDERAALRATPHVSGRRAGNLCCATGIKLDAGGGDIAPASVGAALELRRITGAKLLRHLVFL